MSKITNFLAERFPNNPIAPNHFGELLTDYQCSGLPPPNMVQELTKGGDRALWAHIWEAMLFRHLSALGVDLLPSRVKKSGQVGPDFGFVHEGRTIWIEAVVAAPEGIPAEHLRPPRRGEFKVGTVPNREKLLRWTAVLRDKRDKLQLYVERGIIAETDCTVVAVNGTRLWDFPGLDNGISQMPFAVEATFPVGPIAIPISLHGQQAGDPERTTRYSIPKQNGVEVPTANFLDPDYANVSALMGSTRRDMLDGNLWLTLVHNPLARASLPREILGASKEFVADDEGDHYLLRPLHEP